MSEAYEFCTKNKDKSTCDNYKKIYYACKDACLLEDKSKEIERFKECLNSTKSNNEFLSCKLGIIKKIESNFSRCTATCEVQYFDNLTS